MSSSSRIKQNAFDSTPYLNFKTFSFCYTHTHKHCLFSILNNKLYSEVKQQLEWMGTENEMLELPTTTTKKCSYRKITNLLF